MSERTAGTRRGLVAVAAATAAMWLAPGAAAAKTTGMTWPAYAGNSIRVEVPHGRLVAGSVQRVRLSGRAYWKRPGDTTSYTLGVYIQDAAVDRHCTPTFAGQRQKAINLGSLNATAGDSGWVVDEDQQINAQPPGNTIDWADDSLPLTVRPGVRRVVVCAYVRYIIDDVAYSELPVRIEQPRCRILPRTVRRGRRAALRCNVKGRITARLSHCHKRERQTLRVNRHGRGRLPTRRLGPGRWTARFSAAGWRLGRDRVRVR